MAQQCKKLQPEKQIIKNVTQAPYAFMAFLALHPLIAFNNLMGAYVVTTRTPVADLISAALPGTHVYRFTDTADALGAVVRNGDSKSGFIILDLATIPDAARFITFVKSSAVIRFLPMIVLGTEQQHALLELCVSEILDAALPFPCNASEIAATIAKFNHRKSLS